jgi:hypothetical protein
MLGGGKAAIAGYVFTTRFEVQTLISAVIRPASDVR